MSRPGDALVAPELSRCVEVSTIPPEGQDVGITATGAECDALARRLGVVEITTLSAEMRVLPLASAEGETVWRVTGKLDAAVIQICTVSLEPFSSRVREKVEANFAARGKDGGAAVDLTVDDESPEPLDKGMIDVGELVVQHLALSLDPHPRRPGKTFETDEAVEKLEGTRGGAFAALQHLRGKSGK